MKDLLAWYGFKRYPFDKEIKPADSIETGIFKETLARLEYMKRRGGVMLLTGDPGVGKTMATGALPTPLMTTCLKFSILL